MLTLLTTTITAPIIAAAPVGIGINLSSIATTLGQILSSLIVIVGLGFLIRSVLEGEAKVWEIVLGLVGLAFVGFLGANLQAVFTAIIAFFTV